MSKMIPMYSISTEDQDTLWIHNHCPRCGSRILDINTTVDYAEFKCSRCDAVYYCE